MAEVGYGVGRVRRTEFAGAVGSLTVVVPNGHCQLGEADWGCFPGQSWVEDGVCTAPELYVRRLACGVEEGGDQA
jgi:hypothetical protein